MKVRSYHEINKDHWTTRREFSRWCNENDIKAKWKHGSLTPKNWIGYVLDGTPECQRKARNCQIWEIENEGHAMAAKLVWGEK